MKTKKIYQMELNKTETTTNNDMIRMLLSDIELQIERHTKYADAEQLLKGDLNITNNKIKILKQLLKKVQQI